MSQKGQEIVKCEGNIRELTIHATCGLCLRLRGEGTIQFMEIAPFCMQNGKPIPTFETGKVVNIFDRKPMRIDDETYANLLKAMVETYGQTAVADAYTTVIEPALLPWLGLSAGFPGHLGVSRPGKLSTLGEEVERWIGNKVLVRLLYIPDGEGPVDPNDAVLLANTLTEFDEYYLETPNGRPEDVGMLAILGTPILKPDEEIPVDQSQVSLMFIKRGLWIDVWPDGITVGSAMGYILDLFDASGLEHQRDGTIKAKSLRRTDRRGF